jgi:hypothetical protein
MALAPLQRLRQVAASPTPTACLDRLRRPIACPRTTHWRTSCGQPDAAKGVALGAVAGYVRHCGQHDAHGSTAGQPRAQYGGAAGGWGQASHGRRGATIYSWLDKLYWRLQVPHTYAFRCIWQRQQPAPVLCAGVHHADLLMRWLACPAWPWPGLSGTVGATTLSEEQMPSHTHTGKFSVVGGNGSPLNMANADYRFKAGTIDPTGGSASHTHTLSGASGSTNSLPPYYSLAYIMRCA